MSRTRCSTCLVSVLLALPLSQGFVNSRIRTLESRALRRSRRDVAVPTAQRTRAPTDRIAFALGMSTNSNTGTSNVFDLPEDGMISGSAGSITERVSETTRESHSPYLQGDELQRLRQRVLNLRQSLHQARESGQFQAVQKLSRSILAAQQLDGEFMYQVSLERWDAAVRAGYLVQAEQYRRAAAQARASLPQFQLDGLWVGKYGDAFQMVNVSYCGDVLTAHKVTGEGHVPKGEITFSVDLSPTMEYLEPIELSTEAMEQWGSQYLQRHKGVGQVAAHGYTNHQWLDGQLILVNQYFSFAWLPTGHQVFFGRPSAELTLKMLRHAGDATRDGQDMESPRHYLERCLEETELLNDDMEVSDGIFRSHDQHYYFDQAGCFE